MSPIAACHCHGACGVRANEGRAASIAEHDNSLSPLFASPAHVALDWSLRAALTRTTDSFWSIALATTLFAAWEERHPGGDRLISAAVASMARANSQSQDAVISLPKSENEFLSRGPRPEWTMPDTRLLADDEAPSVPAPGRYFKPYSEASPDDVNDPNFAGYYLTVDVPSSVCCCPVSVTIGGGNKNGTYDLDPRDRPSDFPQCAGHNFNVNVTLKWLPSDIYLPCEVTWEEKNSNSAYPGFYDADAAVFRNEGMHSATVAAWLVRMNRDSDVERQRSESMSGHAEHIALNDRPCYQPTRSQRNDTVQPDRELEGHVTIKSGCPACADKEVRWAQHVNFLAGRLDALFFTQLPPFRGLPSRGPGASDVGSRYAAAAWREAIHDSWTRR
jgi:hypothetical protein